MAKVNMSALIDKARQQMQDRRSDWVHRNNNANKNNGGTGDFQNARFGAIDRYGDSHYSSHACHRPIMDWTDIDIFWNCYAWQKHNEVAGPAYLKWLMHDSPWSAGGLFPKGMTFDSVMAEKGFIFPNVRKVSGNLFHNFLVATRMATEWPHHINAWHSLVTEHKCNPDLAFIFIDCFRPIGGGYTWLTAMEAMPTAEDKYDWPVDVATSIPEYVYNFTHHVTVHASKKPFSPTAWHRPINAVWGRRTLDPGNSAQYEDEHEASRISTDDTYTEFLDKNYREKYAKKSTNVAPKENLFKSNSKSWYGSTFSSTDLYTPEAIISILKEEEVRLGLK